MSEQCKECGGSRGTIVEGGGMLPNGGGGGIRYDGGTLDWRNAPIEKVAEWNPQVALARALRVPLAPWIANIRGTFTSSTSPIGPFSWQIQGGSNDQQRANTFAILDRIVFQIDSPGANAGAAFKPQTDYYFGLQSGIEATLIVDGDPKYIVSPDFTPIRSLCALINEAWPQGWVLTNTNAPKMQFNISNSALIVAYPTKVTATFRMWIPNVGDLRGRQFVMMTDNEAYRQLKKLGYPVPDHCG